MIWPRIKRQYLNRLCRQRQTEKFKVSNKITKLKRKRINSTSYLPTAMGNLNLFTIGSTQSLTKLVTDPLQHVHLYSNDIKHYNNKYVCSQNNKLYIYIRI